MIQRPLHPSLRSATFLGASLFLHLLVMVSLGLFQQTPMPSQKKDQVEIEILDEEEQKEFAEKSKDVPKKQIVEQSKKVFNEEKPDNTRFLSHHDQTVKRETKAARHGKFFNGTGEGLAPEKDQTLQERSPKKQAEKTNKKGPSLKDLAPNFNPENTAQKKQVRKRGRASRSSDHLPDVETGLQTLLSTREFVYYSYYQRIRSKIRDQWEPMIHKKVEKIFNSGRSIASTINHTTKVVIVLNKSGSLVKVQIVSESGVHDLDEAAVDAFRAAEPFPNPPDGIVEKDGMIRIRWDFVLEA